MEGEHIPEAPSLLKTLGELITVLVGAVAFVYLAGAAVLWIRLWSAGLPTDAVVSGLPRELLVAVGLRSVVAPAVPLAVAAGVFLLLAAWRPTSDRAKRIRAGLSVVVGALGGVAVSFYFADRGEQDLALGWLVAFFVVWGISVLIVMSDLPLSIVAVALVALILGLAAAAVRVAVELSDPRLSKARVCVNDGGRAYNGRLIGETENAVYLGDRERVVVIPKSRVGELWIGVAPKRCHVPKPRST